MNYDAIIVGGGIVGLATGFQLLKKRPETKLLILEKEDHVAAHQSGHNSGVIHSGIYYKPGSLKAKNCLDGYRMLIQFADENEIEYDLCGKVIVAVDDSELPVLKQVFEKGMANGMAPTDDRDGVRMISSEEMKEIEPHIHGVQAIWVPQAGIIDYRKVCQKLAELIQKAGGTIKINEEVVDIKPHEDLKTVITDSEAYLGKLVINCAGLYSDKIADLTGQRLNMKILPFRGEYYKIKEERKYLINNLVYPTPDPSFPWLGVHYTRMMDGSVKAGPNAVFAFKREGYKMKDFAWREFYESITYKGFRNIAKQYWKKGAGEFYRSLSKSAFTKGLQRLLPELREEDLVHPGAGVRALACDPDGNLVDDFVFAENQGVINVGNAPSPAATSCLSIGDTVSGMAIKQLS